eukprot:6204106-Pleurochrysis_carterae.AAC.1
MASDCISRFGYGSEAAQAGAKKNDSQCTFVTKRREASTPSGDDPAAAKALFCFWLMVAPTPLNTGAGGGLQGACRWMGVNGQVSKTQRVCACFCCCARHFIDCALVLKQRISTQRTEAFQRKCMELAGKAHGRCR